MPTRRSLLAVATACLLASALPALAQQKPPASGGGGTQTFAGTYALVGTNPDGQGPYGGTVTLQPVGGGGVFRVTWALQ